MGKHNQKSIKLLCFNCCTFSISFKMSQYIATAASVKICPMTMKQHRANQVKFDHQCPIVDSGPLGLGLLSSMTGNQTCVSPDCTNHDWELGGFVTGRKLRCKDCNYLVLAKDVKYDKY